MFGQIAEPAEVAHPYYPLGVDIPHYAANTLPQPVILGSLAGMLGSVMLAASTLALRLNPGLGRGQLAVFCWFVMCKSDMVPGKFRISWSCAQSTKHSKKGSSADEHSNIPGGSLHCFFEGYFVFNHATVASSQNLFAQLWKEYALSDSRYLTSDPFMLSVESITVVCVFFFRRLSLGLPPFSTSTSVLPFSIERQTTREI